MTAETLTERRAMSEAYIACALWAGLDWSDEDADNNPEPLNTNYSRDDLSEQAYEEIVRACADFLAFVNPADLDGLDPEQIGHDFYLTRNGHGAGFWDRGLGAAGDRLSEACRPYGTSELYVGDDGLLYVHS